MNKMSLAAAVVGGTTSMLPLFDSLLRKITGRKPIVINETYNKLLFDTINSLNTKQLEQVLILIIHGNILSSGTNVFRPEVYTSKARAKKLPYNIRMNTEGKGLSLCFDSLSNDMKLILGEYCLLNEAY